MDRDSLVALVDEQCTRVAGNMEGLLETIATPPVSLIICYTSLITIIAYAREPPARGKTTDHGPCAEYCKIL